MHVEQCCQALLAYAIPRLDPERKGTCIDVGVGTFAFYCKIFARLGFKTIAIEPLPVKEVRQLCKMYGIRLFESCLTDQDGTQTIYIGRYENSENLNLSSLIPDWWGASTEEKKVKTMELNTLSAMIETRGITCMKIDVEGTEHTIIKQFTGLSEERLPQIIMFEYGGGDNRQSEKSGWSKKYLDPSIKSLEVLKQCGYQLTLVIDSADDTQERILDLSEGMPTPETLFHPKAIYGNIIGVRGETPLQKTEIVEICSAYRDNNKPAQPLRLPASPILLRINWMIRSLFS
jgi:FkbM family methyltransferase